MRKKCIRKQVNFNENISVFDLLEKIEKVVEENKGKDYEIVEIAKDSVMLKIWKR